MENQSAHIWDLHGSSVNDSFPNHLQPVTSAQWMNNEHNIVIASGKTVRIWPRNEPDNALPVTFDTHNDEVSSHRNGSKWQTPRYGC